jgi:hypothetical protein
MDIDKFSPAKHLLWANKTSGSGYSGQNVYVTGESLAEGLSLGTALRTTFTGLQVQTMGTSPLALNTPNGFIPVQVSIVISNATTRFNFDTNDSVFITGGQVIFDGGTTLQNLTDNIPHLIRQESVGRSYTDPLTMTTKDGGDATEGDSTVDVYVFGYYL